MRYEGPIYRPPSEADSLLIQATVGCPHNKCTFCMIYKKGPRFKIRKVAHIKGDLQKARSQYGARIETLFFPAGNTIAMKTDDLVEICQYARSLFPHLTRITVYGSSNYILHKGLNNLKKLSDAGLSRIHVGMESGCDKDLKRIRKGANQKQQIDACQSVMQAGIELSVYVILGMGGKNLTRPHALDTAQALNAISPDFIRLRTLIPKINTHLLEEIRQNAFTVLTPHEVLRKSRMLLENLTARSALTSDHYSNYVNLEGHLPEDGPTLVNIIERALNRDETSFREYFIGTQ